MGLLLLLGCTCELIAVEDSEGRLGRFVLDLGGRIQRKTGNDVTVMSKKQKNRTNKFFPGKQRDPRFFPAGWPWVASVAAKRR